MNRPPFQAFSLHGNGRLNRLITAVRVGPAFDPASPPNPLPTMIEFQGLWDTGATNSSITPKVAAALSLVCTGVRRVGHAGGASDMKAYVVNLGLPNRVGVAAVNVTEFEGRDFDVLIGMDVIGIGDFTVTNHNGDTCFSFRIPSQSRVDYVKEADRILFKNVGRNQPCPCGSQKKFKQCCEARL